MTMRNRPTPIYDANEPSRSGLAWDVDAEPALRLTWLFVAMTLPLLAVAGRLVQLQWFLADDFAIDERRETVSVEPIPSRNGRIISAEGTVLAFDEERFRVLLHYRWLEEPPDERWLRNEAASRLSLSERRNKHKVEQAQQEVLARRAALWQSLAELTDRTPVELADARRRIQQRVERIFQAVEEHQANTPAEVVSGTALAAGVSPGNIDFATPVANAIPLTPPANQHHVWVRAWDVVKHELTTPPTRAQRDSLRIPEQADYHLLIENVPLEVIAELETHPDQFPGVRTDVSTRRVYPQGRLVPHLVGYRGEIDSAELTARRARFPHGDPLDYRPGDMLGRAGIEQSYEHILRGVRGQRKIVRDQNGTIVRTEVVRPPRIGRDVVLNVSVALQEKASALLNEVVEDATSRTGTLSRLPESTGNLSESTETTGKSARPTGACLVAIDVQTGAILAAASAPSFDVNDLLAGSEDVRRALFADARRPMFSRATQMTLPPGSVFKTVSAVALLESGRIDPDQSISCAGYLDQPNKLRCYHSQAHYETDLTQAIARSCNVYFFKAARTIGPRPLVDWSDRFGFGQLTGVDVPAEVSGHVPRPPDETSAALAKVRSGGKASKSKSAIALASHEQVVDTEAEVFLPNSPWDDEIRSRRERAAPNETWYSGDTLGLAIGQSRLTVTPLQIARLMAAVANNGWLVTPHVAREIEASGERQSPDESSVEAEQLESNASGADRPSLAGKTINPPRRRIPGLTEGTLARVREGLEQVVAHPQGTGHKNVRLNEVAIAGKTGTAENSGPDHAWFAGYVPADRPQVAFVVVLEHGGSGGKAAGPVAKKFVQMLLDEGIVRKKQN